MNEQVTKIHKVENINVDEGNKKIDNIFNDDSISKIDKNNGETFSSELGVHRLPKTEQELDQVDEILANEFNNLSMGEREKVMFDVHGISQACDIEDPSNIEEILQQLEIEIEKIKRKDSYDLAKSINPGYVTSRDFRLMFLRCERYQPKLSAKRIVGHFAIKEEVFGSPNDADSNRHGSGSDDVHVLARSIRMSDLNGEDMSMLESGCMQFLPQRDASGRIVFFISLDLLIETSLKTMVRTSMYLFMKILEDEDAQKKGVVCVACNVSMKGIQYQFGTMIQACRLRGAFPERTVGVHICYNDPFMRPYIAGIQLLMMRDQRTRFRAHFGSEQETMFELQTYGIDTSLLPTFFKKDGTISVSWHREWIRIQRGKEELNAELSASSSSSCLIPRRFDVLFGRSKKCREHTGNLRASHLVSMYTEQYETATRFQKMEIADRIVSMIHESYGRFLKWDPDYGWVQVDSDTAREKISHFFRHGRRKSGKTGSSISSTPSTSTATTTEPLQIGNDGTEKMLKRDGVGISTGSCSSEDASHASSSSSMSPPPLSPSPTNIFKFIDVLLGSGTTPTDGSAADTATTTASLKRNNRAEDDYGNDIDLKDRIDSTNHEEQENNDSPTPKRLALEQPV